MVKDGFFLPVWGVCIGQGFCCHKIKDGVCQSYLSPYRKCAGGRGNHLGCGLFKVPSEETNTPSMAKRRIGQQKQKKVEDSWSYKKGRKARRAGG